MAAARPLEVTITTGGDHADLLTLTMVAAALAGLDGATLLSSRAYVNSGRLALDAHLSVTDEAALHACACERLGTPGRTTGDDPTEPYTAADAVLDHAHQLAVAAGLGVTGLAGGWLLFPVPAT